MHPEDLLIIGVPLVLVSAFVIVLMINKRERERRLLSFRQACGELGLEHRQDGWYGDRFGVPVSVFWGRIGRGHGKSQYVFWFTVYTAHFEPPLDTGMVCYTGIERYVRKAGAGDEVHVAAVEYWNDLELPGGGTLWDVWKAPKSTPLEHVDVSHEALSKRVCVYSRNAEASRSQLDGELAESILMVANACDNIWLDDSRMILLILRDGPRRAGEAIGPRASIPHHEKELIEEWLKKTATFANEIRRLSA